MEIDYRGEHRRVFACDRPFLSVEMLDNLVSNLECWKRHLKDCFQSEALLVDL